MCCVDPLNPPRIADIAPPISLQQARMAGSGKLRCGAPLAPNGKSGPFGTNSKMIALSDRLLLATALDPYEPKFASFADCRARIGLSF